MIQLLQLEPLSNEGGFYRQTFKSHGRIPSFLLSQHTGERAYGTAIYYLITPESFSALHLVPQDEMFHFYAGDAVEMLQIQPSGEIKSVILGNRLQEGHSPQVLVGGNIWQGTRLVRGGQWALLGCTVCPGFEFEDFQMKSREELTALFPQHREWIHRFTHA